MGADEGIAGFLSFMDADGDDADSEEDDVDEDDLSPEELSERLMSEILINPLDDEPGFRRQWLRR